MKSLKKILLPLFLFTACALGFSPSAHAGYNKGGAAAPENRIAIQKCVTMEFHSNILGVTKKYNVYLPKGYYDNPGRKYPVLYLLHGHGGCYNDWNTTGDVTNVANRMIKAKQAKPMIIIMPDAGETLMDYFNTEGWRYEDFFFKEFLPAIEKTYRIDARKSKRAIAGLSMGGQGTIVYAMHHPELFSTAYGMSAYLYSTKDIPNIKDPVEKRVQQLVQDNNAVVYAKNATSNQINSFKSVNWLLNVGDDDFTFPANIEFFNTFKKRGVPIELRVRDGYHCWEYWRACLRSALTYVSVNFE
ncbi:MAG: esterase family protein [Bacteroidales bacterium]|nr:esterase family protein [Bacteroidales bacterium]